MILDYPSNTVWSLLKGKVPGSFVYENKIIWMKTGNEDDDVSCNKLDSIRRTIGIKTLQIEKQMAAVDFTNGYVENAHGTFVTIV